MQRDGFNKAQIAGPVLLLKNTRWLSIVQDNLKPWLVIFYLFSSILKLPPHPFQFLDNLRAYYFPASELLMVHDVANIPLVSSFPEIHRYPTHP